MSRSGLEDVILVAGGWGAGTAIKDTVSMFGVETRVWYGVETMFSIEVFFLTHMKSGVMKYSKKA